MYLQPACQDILEGSRNRHAGRTERWKEVTSSRPVKTMEARQDRTTQNNKGKLKTVEKFLEVY